MRRIPPAQRLGDFQHRRGRTWSDPQPLPPALTGDRHPAVRPRRTLGICFRDTTRQSVTQGDWGVDWGVDDIVQGTEGRCRVRLMDNHHRWDLPIRASNCCPTAESSA